MGTDLKVEGCKKGIVWEGFDEEVFGV